MNASSPTRANRHAHFEVVIPTIGRPSLAPLLESLASRSPSTGIVVVDDRRRPTTALPGVHERPWIRVVRGAGAGPAAARNAGWRVSAAEWIAFLDDDVELPEGWADALDVDLRSLPADVAASQGRIRVPRPANRRATDWERNVAGLEEARWATADMAYRRSVLERVGGFDERFPRAYREDADLGLRVVAAGYRIVLGRRQTVHPVPATDAWVSVRLQAGNADDALMRRLHGADWRGAAGVPAGRRPLHVAVVALGVTAIGATAMRRTGVAMLAGAGWLAGTAELAIARIVPGPRTSREVATMLATSVALPWAATYHWIRGLVRAATIASGDALTLGPRGA